jgi:hypothetical protein
MDDSVKGMDKNAKIFLMTKPLGHEKNYRLRYNCGARPVFNLNTRLK